MERLPHSRHSPGILRSGNPSWWWSSVSPSTACTWFSALPAGLVPALLGPPGPRRPSSHTCPCGVAAALSRCAAPLQGRFCRGQCVSNGPALLLGKIFIAAQNHKRSIVIISIGKQQQLILPAAYFAVHDSRCAEMSQQVIHHVIILLVQSYHAMVRWNKWPQSVLHQLEVAFSLPLAKLL